ncbi:hypothetical protein EPVG_00188 [Emiliania huxleyi virus 201]|nr:hypothetical protein ELVG_00114 [Emiliania huxleyi virus 203]AEP15521.1 hypothetical protein EQVG_00111 [Emiliania huxleyi virus 207]AEP15943.1 hypothetical protein ERVG_00065 [Emiliania huxleyi virus 208]AET98075.1 hypothetical protein EPVG_00188 [Emiliania huxleyi virus 201]
MSGSDVDFYRESYKNRENLKKSDGGQCYSCFHEFKYSGVEDWADADLTAICPHCMVDAVVPYNKLPDDLDDCKDLMEAWHKRGFGTAKLNHEDDRKKLEDDIPQYESDPDEGVKKTINVFIDKTTKSQPKKVGRNDQCPCGSGKKYKKCCVTAE